jgi:hypothetical protein
MERNQMANMRRLLILFLAAAVFAAFARAQQKNVLPACSFSEANYQQGKGALEVHVGFAVNPASAKKPPVDWELIDATSGSVIHIKTPAPLDQSDLWLPTPLDVDHKYFVTVFGLPGCSPDKPPIASVTIPKSSTTIPPSVPSSHASNGSPASNAGHGLILSPSKARTDSDLYLSGLLTGATGQKAAYTADIKTQLDYILRQASEASPELALLPSFDFTASTNPKQDGNSLTFGTALRIAWADQVPPLSFFHLYTLLEPGGAVEADPSFRVIEPIARVPIYAIPKALLSGPFVAYFQPTFGIEAGGSTKMPSTGDYAALPTTLPKTGTVFRPFAGANLYVNFNKKSKTGSGTKTIFSLETDYINRWPIVGEPIFSQASTGKLLLLGIGTQPRGYVTTKVERDLGSYFSIASEYDYGKLPPLYTKVDNKYSLSLTYKAALKAGAGAK